MASGFFIMERYKPSNPDACAIILRILKSSVENPEGN